jgi:hypothetical protein
LATGAHCVGGETDVVNPSDEPLIGDIETSPKIDSSDGELLF